MDGVNVANQPAADKWRDRIARDWMIKCEKIHSFRLQSELKLLISSQFTALPFCGRWVWSLGWERGNRRACGPDSS